MTEQEKKQLVVAVITQLKRDGTDVSSASVVEDVNGVSYILCYDTNGNIVRVSPDTINQQESTNAGAIDSLAVSVETLKTDLNDTNNNLAETQKDIASSLHASSGADSVTITGKSNVGRTTFSTDIPAATPETAGVMSANDKKKLNNLAVEGTNVDLNTYYSDGVYVFNHKSLTNVPILDDSVVSARLTVLTAYDGISPVITQVLNLNNLGGGEGNIYIRSYQNGTWKPWGKLQTNIEVGQVNTLDHLTDNGIYSGVWTKGSYNAYPLTFVCVVINDYFVGIEPRRISQFVYGLSKFDGSTVYQSRVWDDSKNAWGDWEILNQKEISSMISNEINKITDGVDPEKLDSLKDLIAWVDAHAGTVAEIKNDIQANKTAIETEVERATNTERKLEEKITKEKTALANGDTIVALAREVYSRQGKTDTVTFLKRTTAGGTSISDGVASIRQIGGSIVKNIMPRLVPTNVNIKYNIKETYGIFKISAKEAYIEDTTGSSYIGYKSLPFVKGHSYYVGTTCFRKSDGNKITLILGFNGINVIDRLVLPEIPANEWHYVSGIKVINGDNITGNVSIYPFGVTNNPMTAEPLLILGGINIIDLTEMFGAGKEPTKEECDKMFGTMDTLPQGLTIAQSTGLKSTGFNQWNPANVLLNKSIVENAIEDDVADRHIAVVECLPCKTGAGENNGYVIGYGEGYTWNEANIEVYLSPLNPLDYIGQDVDLYMHKLEKDATYGTYVPQIKGYLLVVTPTTDKLCAHFHWSGDRAKTDYEPYIESNLSLPQIPEMSEWGLAAISVRGTTVQDIIDLENKRYKKSIGYFDIGSKVGVMIGNIYHISIPDAAKSIAGVVPNLLCAKYKTVLRNNMDTLGFNTISQNNNTSTITLYDSSCTTAEEYAAKLKGVMLYYELAIPEEYPIVAKSAPNYIGSDYGVEVFMGSKVPLNANILFYMRSLVSETRNFLDRLMARLGISDATAVADKIADAIIPTTEATDVEPTEVIEE